jgi:hypothetical protein
MNRIRQAVIGAALAGTALTGGALGATLLNGTANAQTATTDTATADSPAAATAPPARDPNQGGHMANGVTETLLTGDTAAKVKAAALAAVPGGTVERVENDAEGSPYEAHMVKADGSHVTVKVDSAFNVTGIETGPGPR